MTRQLEQEQEIQQTKRNKALVRAIEYELAGAVAHSGGDLQGFSVKLGGYETLVTLRVILAGRPQISFVGSSNLGEALLKCVRLAKSDKLNWRDDKFA